MVDVEPAWLAKARSHLGFHEQPNNTGIGQFITSAKCGEEGDPWCAIFANACIEDAGYKGTRSAMARAFEHSSDYQELDKPAPGAVVTMWRGSPGSGTGHCTFYTGDSSGKMLCLGGNQDDEVNIKSFADDNHITGFWWPKTAVSPSGTQIIAVNTGQTFTGITATVFGGPNDAQPVAYPDVGKGWDSRLGVALPFHFAGPRPKVIVTANGKSVTCPIVDVGPWNVNDAYWKTTSRPQAESGTDKKGRQTNKAGIDLTPATAQALGIDGKGLVDWKFADMSSTTQTPTPATPTPSAPILNNDQATALAQAIAPLVEQMAANVAHAVLAKFLPAVGSAVGPSASSGFLEAIFAGIAKYLPELSSVAGAGVFGAMGLGALGTTTPAGIISLISVGLPFILGLINRGLPPHTPPTTPTVPTPAFKFPFPIKLT